MFKNIDNILKATAPFSTPFFLVDESLIERNLKILADVKKKSGAKILLAQKAFSCFDVYPLIAKYLCGTTASGLYEAKLAHDHFLSKDNHVFAPAFTSADMQELVKICTHIVFNSIAQLQKHADICRKNNVSISLRVNPEHSTQEGHSLYDPCAEFSRFGVTAVDIGRAMRAPTSTYHLSPNLDGLHFHTLCQQGFSDLNSTFNAFENKFGELFFEICKNAKLKGKRAYLNMGGGHHITREGYDVEGLIGLIKHIQKKYDCDVYLEPGEAVVLNAGYLISEVLDVVHNGMPIAILDTSAACHNPDILETQHSYMPPIYNAQCTMHNAQLRLNSIRLAGNTCLSGDVIGDYKFDKQLVVGDRIVFGDMALYTMVKTNTFNGIPLPHIYIKRLNGHVECVRVPHYNDFKFRLGS